MDPIKSYLNVSFRKPRLFRCKYALYIPSKIFSKGFTIPVYPKYIDLVLALMQHCCSLFILLTSSGIQISKKNGSFVWWYINLWELSNAKVILEKEQWWYYLTYSRGDERVYTFPKANGNCMTGGQTCLLRGCSPARESLRQGDIFESRLWIKQICFKNIRIR